MKKWESFEFSTSLMQTGCIHAKREYVHVNFNGRSYEEQDDSFASINLCRFSVTVQCSCHLQSSNRQHEKVPHFFCSFSPNWTN